MKVMSFNTQHCQNYIEKTIDFEIMAKAIRDCDADIVGLNEMRGSGAHSEYTAQTEALSALTGMKYYHFAPAIQVPGKGPYGNAFLSRIPIQKAETIMIPDPEPKAGHGHYETRCILKVTLEDGTTVLVTHFGLNPDEQDNAVKTVLDSITDQKCILMGDFNVRPENPVLDPIRKRMKDTAEAFTAPKNSFPSDAPKSKIDYIFVSPDIEIICADIPPIVASDHRPHTATLQI